MIEYRTITKADVPQAMAFVTDGMRPDLYPGVFAQDKVRAVLEYFATTGGGFHLGAYEDGKPVGAIAALVQEREWKERMSAHVVCCRATVPGVGRRLVRALLDWADGQPMIQHVSFALECDADPRMRKLLERYGFSRQQVVMHYFKGDHIEAKRLAHAGRPSEGEIS